MEKNIDKIDIVNFLNNPNIFMLDCDKMKEKMSNSEIAEELASKVFNPNRLIQICEKYNVEFDKLTEILN